MNLLAEVEKIAIKAGAAIMAIYQKEYGVLSKADQSPLTEADTLANSIITDALTTLTPSIPILSEEAVENFAGPNSDGQYWLVDPLDGTKEFIKRNGEFTVNIALIEGGKPSLGVVYAPALEILYSAATNLGAFKVNGSGQRTSIQVKPHTEGFPWKVVGSRSHGGDMTDWLKKLDSYELIPMGSSLKFCLVAEGAAHLYPRLGPTSLWDTAAAQCVVDEAGGEVVQLNGQPISYTNPSQRLNPFFIVRTKS